MRVHSRAVRVSYEAGVTMKRLLLGLASAAIGVGICALLDLPRDWRTFVLFLWGQTSGYLLAFNYYRSGQ